MCIFEKNELYQISPEIGKSQKEDIARNLMGKVFINSEMTYKFFNIIFEKGASIKITKITKEFDYEMLKAQYKDKLVPVFIISENDNLIVNTVEKPLDPSPGQKLVFLVNNNE